MQSREAIADFLPRAIQTALDSYQHFSEAQITDTDSTPCSKTFKAASIVYCWRLFPCAKSIRNDLYASIWLYIAIGIRRVM